MVRVVSKPVPRLVSPGALVSCWSTKAGRGRRPSFFRLARRLTNASYRVPLVTDRVVHMNCSSSYRHHRLALTLIENNQSEGGRALESAKAQHQPAGCGCLEAPTRGLGYRARRSGRPGPPARPAVATRGGPPVDPGSAHLPAASQRDNGRAMVAALCHWPAVLQRTLWWCA